MKRIITAVLLVTLFAAMAALAGRTTSAHADPRGNETCGGILTNGTWLFNPNTNTWTNGQPPVQASFNCGDGKTFTWEVLHTTNGGATFGDWWGSGNEPVHTSPAGCNNGCTAVMAKGNSSCASTGSYRVVMNNNSRSYRSPWVGAGLVCSGHFNSGT